MPELPEVETVLRGLLPHTVGQRIRRAMLLRQDLRWPVPSHLSAAMSGQRVIALARRGKYLIAHLSSESSVIFHLGMSGRLVVTKSDPGALRVHEHFRLVLDSGAVISFIDPRRFGMIDITATADIDTHRLICNLGPEPLSRTFTGQYLAHALAGRRSPLKPILLDQRVVAGLGNIYVSEALYAAGLSPSRPAQTVTKPETLTLARAIKHVLRAAIAAGGSSLRDYVQPNGELGYFQHTWRVYGREGQPCRRCPAAIPESTPTPCPLIQRVKQGGRSTYYCPRTQT